jgi:DNA-binding response OmpR family regulator
MKIVVLDDDPVVGNGLVRLLRQYGHRALYVRRAADARAIIASQDYVDLAIAEGESGAEFLSWLRREHPQVRRVLTSAIERPRDFRDEPPTQVFVQKPFAAPALAAILRGTPTCAT